MVLKFFFVGVCDQRGKGSLLSGPRTELGKTRYIYAIKLGKAHDVENRLWSRMATENLPHVVTDIYLFASIKCFFSKIAKALNMNNFKAPLPQLQGKRDKIEVVFELLWKDSCN